MKRQNCVIWTQIVSQFHQNISEDVKKDSTVQIMKQIDRCMQEKNKKAIGLMKDELGGQIIKTLFDYGRKHIVI